MARISPKKKFRDFTSQYLRHPGSEQLLNTQEGPPIMEMLTEKQRLGPLGTCLTFYSVEGGARL